MAAKSILITGGTGLIGSHLSGALAQRGHTIKVLSRNSRFSVPEAIDKSVEDKIEVVAGELDDRQLLEELVNQADVIFYKAASVGAAGAVENAKDFVENNLGATANLVDVLRARKHHVKEIILGSSISVYGEGAYSCLKHGVVRPPIRYRQEELKLDLTWDPLCPECGGMVAPADTDETSEKLGESTYSVTKKAQEELLIGTCKLLDINLSVFRYSTVIGAGQSWHNPFTRFLELALSGEAPVIHEDGLQSRDFMFVEDVVAANLAVLDKQISGLNVFNVGSGKSTALFNFARSISEAMAFTLKNKSAVSPNVDKKFIPGDVRHCHTDCKKIAELTGLRPNQNLDEGILKLAEWFVRKKGPLTRFAQ
ncbi:MAG TPA: NAD-dependent epimerase/dehydratase family protein [Drouetiella sp.]